MFDKKCYQKIFNFRFVKKKVKIDLIALIFIMICL